ncbi:hypothetical protein [Parasphingopyxis sp.]|uniref:hypothetical protein n=1 Tax=Parasphingopyxis sp. TaxID=1920299 RepID=UPI002612B09F|nr:hypothetical protein [Parasphingopyxis sp.]
MMQSDEPNIFGGTFRKLAFRQTSEDLPAPDQKDDQEVKAVAGVMVTFEMEGDCLDDFGYLQMRFRLTRSTSDPQPVSVSVHVLGVASPPRQIFEDGEIYLDYGIKSALAKKGKLKAFLFVSGERPPTEGWSIECVSLRGGIRSASEINRSISAARTLAKEEQGDAGWFDHDQLIDGMIEFVESGRPMSMVRFGDGEGRILGYPSDFSNSETIPQCLRYMFGRKALDEIYARDPVFGVPNAMMELQGFLRESIQEADFLGTSSFKHMRLDGTGNVIWAQLAFCRAYLACREKISALGADRAFDTFIFRFAARHGSLDRLINILDHVTFVTHTDPRPKFLDRYPNVKRADFIQIPGHASFTQPESSHYPSEYRNIVDRLRVEREGSVFLVGGGYLGKLYCTEIKRRGGIAIDLGGVFDAWMGVGRSRLVKQTDLRL